MAYTLNVRGRLLSTSRPLVMGILNITPDSFYSGSRKQTEAEIARRANEIVEQGGAIIDVGAFSTRPGAVEVSVEEECRRLKMALETVRREQPDVPISVDTYRPLVARRCVEEWGADIINDVSEGGVTGIVNTPIDEEGSMFETVGALRVPYILMSVRSNINEMVSRFSCEVQQLRDYGCTDIVLDAGFCFGKSLQDNYEVLAAHDKLKALGLPILVGVSRKTMIYRLIGGTPEDALNGTTVINTIALLHGADILRVHDVRQAVEAVNIVHYMRTGQQPQH